MAYRIPQLDDATAARDRTLVSRAGIEHDLEQTRRAVEAARAHGAIPDGLASRLDGLTVCRRMADRPEKCAKPPPET
jgi:hypothetical protein